jgi:hypothetical protein
MWFPIKLLGLYAILLVGVMKIRDVSANQEIHICSAENPKFLGSYSAGKEVMDGAPVYSNANDMSFFRNKGFWYIGNLGPWPPETVYRCVEPEGCGYGQSFPPASSEGAWRSSKKNSDGNVPVISKEPCGAANDEL